MYLSEIIGDKDAILTHAMRHPALSPKRKPTIDDAMKSVVASIETVAVKAVTEKYEPLIEDAYQMYLLTNGELQFITDEPERDAWSSGMDDEVEKLLEPLTQVLSADWLGRYTIDTHLEEENGPAKLAAALGKEVFKQLAYGKEPGQVLSNAGIVRTDVELYFEQHMKTKTETEKAEMAEQTEQDVDGMIAAIFGHLGADFDHMNVFADLECVADDDEILQGGAAARLGIDQAGIDAMQLHVLDKGAEAAVQDVFDRLVAYKPGDAAAEKPKRTRSAAPAAAKPAAPAGWDGARVLSLLKDHSAAKETELATELGVSRSTFVNWTKGKAAFVPDDAQKETLRNRVLADVNGLYEALCALDGVAPDRTFE